MARVRFCYEMEIDEDVLREDLELDNNYEFSDEEIINEAITLFDYEIQDREIYARRFKCEIVQETK